MVLECLDFRAGVDCEFWMGFDRLDFKCVFFHFGF